MTDTDTDKLKRLAEAWAACEPMPTLYNTADDGKAILALIAKNERLKETASVLTMRYGEVNADNEKIEAERAEFKAWFRRASEEINAVTDQRDEAVALLREWCSVGNPMERGYCHNKTDAFLARMDTVASQPAAVSTLGNEGQQQEVG